MGRKIRVGVSSCLLGNPVRYDGSHRHECRLTEDLAAYFDFIPVCPEVECGFPVPRETMQLEGDPEQPHLFTTDTRLEQTARMLSFCEYKVSRLEKEDLCAFIFKKSSPSCGLNRVKVFTDSGEILQNGRGLFAGAFTKRLPHVPVEEEDFLHHAGRYEHFLERVFCYRRWRDYLQSPPSRQGLIFFHNRHRQQIMAHSTGHLAKMDQLLYAENTVKAEQLIDCYQVLLTQALALKSD